MDKDNSYDARYLRFVRDMSKVSEMKPKQRYLYRIMDGVPFKDLETALLMVKTDYKLGRNND